MHLLPHSYHKLALLVHTDELMAAGMNRRRAKITAALWLLGCSLRRTYRRP